MSDTFRKTGPASSLAMFQAEAEGLEELRAAGEIRVPEVIDCGLSDGASYIVLERLRLQSASRKVEQRFGEQLAALHRHTQERFGWHRDNTIGPTPQINTLCEDWLTFFREHRLRYQLDLAAENGYGADVSDLGARLLAQLPTLLSGYEPEASLLHGDLWGGNWGSTDGEPVIFDPAVYYGDREGDIAMTMLFGGFGRAFYDAYDATWPMAPGHTQRLKLYQLYHVLNHLNLFGRSYLSRAIGIMRELT